MGSIGGTNWGVMLRYAGEHNGFRIASGIGYDHTGDVFTPHGSVAASASTTGGQCHRLASTWSAPARSRSGTPNVNAWGAALSVMHIHTGLFLQGSYQGVQYNNAGSTTSGYWGETCDGSTSCRYHRLGYWYCSRGLACNPKKDASWWQIQGGIAKNWTGWGNTVLYGEYGQFHDLGCGGGWP